MTSLTMLLLQASMERLRELAAYWGLGEVAGSQEALASRLMQELATPWNMGSLLDRLSAVERRVLDKLLDQTKGYLPLPALAQCLELAPTELDDVLAALNRGAVVLVEEVQAPKAAENHRAQGQLAVGAERVAHVPVEIVGVLRQERQTGLAGDRTALTLRKLLEALDVAGLQRLAKHWHVLAPHEYFRKDLVGLLEQRLRDRAVLEGALGQIEAELRPVLETIKDRGGKVTVRALREQFPDSLLHRAYARLAELFLLHQTYVDGERGLFMPVEVLASALGPAPVAPSAALESVAAPANSAEAGYALAWDLLSLVSFLAQQPAELTVADRRLPKRVVARLNGLFQVRDTAPEGSQRLDYLLHLAAKLGLVEEAANRLRATAAVANWTTLGFARQTKEIYDLWLSDRSWYESAGFEALYWGSDRAAVRQRLVGYLRDNCQPGTWYTLASFLRRLKAADPYFLRSPGDVLRLRGYRAVGEATRNWDQVEGRLVAALLAGPLQWLGLLSLGTGCQGALVSFSLTPLGAWLVGSPGATAPAPPPERSLVVQPNFDVVVLYPESAALYQLLRFTRLLHADRASVYGISRESVLAGLASGLQVEDIVRFLATHSQKDVPQNVTYSIADWARHFKPLHLSRVVLLEVDDPALLDELAHRQTFASLLVRQLSDRTVLLRDGIDLQRLAQELRKEGYAPRVAGEEVRSAVGEVP